MTDIIAAHEVDSIAKALREIIADGNAQQIQLFVDGMTPLGPGELTEHATCPDLFTIMTQAQMGPGGQVVILPITIHVRRIFGYSTGPTDKHGANMVVMPGGGGGRFGARS